MDEYQLCERQPTVEEYHRFREVVRWCKVDDAVTAVGLDNSLYSVCVLFRDQVVGFGRVVGDGGIYFYIQDIIVLPEHQGKGIGKMIMDAVMEFIAAKAKCGSFIGLMAAEGVAEFYERYGFVERAADRPGMYQLIE